jgi:5-methylcytosine-specific restriction endonuclease McrA
VAKGRKPLLENQVRGICIECNVYPQMPGPLSKLGYKKYTKYCSGCAKKKYGTFSRPYRQKKKPHCERCGFIPEDLCQLDIHHIDRNNKNNTINNLMTLCSNCHRLEHKEERKVWARLSSR